MANWKIHNNIAIKCKNLLEVSKLNEYLLGAIFPDCLRLQGEYDSRLVHELHAYIPDFESEAGYQMDLFRLPNLTKFTLKYKEEIKKYDFFKGWLTHLCVDYIFNEYANRKVITLSSKEVSLRCRDEVRVFSAPKIAIGFKQDDFAIYSRKLIATEVRRCVLPEEVAVEIKRLIGYDFPMYTAVTSYNNIITKDPSNPDLEPLLFTVEEYDNICKRCQQYIDSIYDVL